MYLGTYGDIADRSRYLGHVYIITSYKFLYDVIPCPCHDKFLCNWMSLRVLAWRWVERQFPTIFTHKGLMVSYVWRNIQKELVQSSLSNFKHSTERGHTYCLGPWVWAQNLAGHLFIYFLSICLLFTLFTVMRLYCFYTNTFGQK